MFSPTKDDPMTAYDSSSAFSRNILAVGIRQELTRLGFGIIDLPGTKETVFAKPSTRLAGVEIRVFSTIEGSAVRASGDDSIKVCAVYTGGERPRGLFKERRVFRTGQLEEIPGRVRDRIKLTAAELAGVETCDCGAPKGTSKAGKKYCMALCWTR